MLVWQCWVPLHMLLLLRGNRQRSHTLQLPWIRFTGTGRWFMIHRLMLDSTPSISPLALCVRHQHTSSDSADGYYGSLYPGHIPTTVLQKALLAVGSGVAALQNPYRHGKRPQLEFISLHDPLESSLHTLKDSLTSFWKCKHLGDRMTHSRYTTIHYSYTTLQIHYNTLQLDYTTATLHSRLTAIHYSYTKLQIHYNTLQLH